MIVCLSCGSERPVTDMIRALRPNFEVIPGQYVCRDVDACYDAYKAGGGVTPPAAAARP